MTSVQPIFPWKAQYSVRIEEIDKQHQKLIGFINDLHAAMMRGEGKQELERILGDLIRYTESHFTFEERLLRTRGYAELAAHQAQHRNLTKQVLELRDRFAAGKMTVTMEMMQFLKNWLANHILGADMRYSKELVS